MTDTTDQSRRAQKTPLPPEVLADALHDRTHENSGRLLKASPIVVSDNAALLRDLDSAAAGVQRLDRLDAESTAAAIRALEAKAAAAEAAVLEVGTLLDWMTNDRDRMTEALANLLARIHRDGGHYMTQHGAEKAAEDADAIVAELFADRDHWKRSFDNMAGQSLADQRIARGWQETAEKFREESDRLAGEVERLTKHVSRLEHANDTAFAELAAARENEARLDYLHRKWARPSEGPRDGRRWHLSTAYFYGETFYEAIDAARRAGEGKGHE